LVVAAGLPLAGCGATPKPAPDKIIVQLSWFHTVEFAGFYAAVQQGYYAAENLDVTLVPGGFDIFPWQEVAAGRAAFGVAGADSVLLARSQGLAIQGIATIFRRSPVVFMALADSGIRTPQDMAGKRVGVIAPTMDNTNDIQLIGMLKKVGLDPDAVELVPIEDYSVGSLTSGALDVYSGFSTNEAVDAQQKGIGVNLIFPQDYGLNIYANVILANDTLLQERPDVAVRFLRATFQGYEYAIEHPEEAAALAVQYDTTLDQDFQVASMHAEIPLIDTGDAPIGTMDPQVWEDTQDTMVTQGFLAAPLDLRTVYTNDFIRQAGSPAK
jgi:NitT/TauT family transport system substrate-binding protein